MTPSSRAQSNIWRTEENEQYLPSHTVQPLSHLPPTCGSPYKMSSLPSDIVTVQSKVRWRVNPAGRYVARSHHQSTFIIVFSNSITMGYLEKPATLSGSRRQQSPTPASGQVGFLENKHEWWDTETRNTTALIILLIIHKVSFSISRMYRRSYLEEGPSHAGGRLSHLHPHSPWGCLDRCQTRQRPQGPERRCWSAQEWILQLPETTAHHCRIIWCPTSAAESDGRKHKLYLTSSWPVTPLPGQAHLSFC